MCVGEVVMAALDSYGVGLRDAGGDSQGSLF
jgi:hypothetical protein